MALKPLLSTVQATPSDATNFIQIMQNEKVLDTNIKDLIKVDSKDSIQLASDLNIKMPASV